jgi:Protein of unknown function (DUF1659)
MANRTFDGKTLILVLEDGVNAKGEPKLVRKSFKHFNETVTEDQLLEIGGKLAALYEIPLNYVSVDEDYVLSV